ncbi:MAG: hypothetical protein V4687_06515 [Bacteroidota bacterium]
MRNLIYALAVTILFFSCSGRNEAVFVPRVLNDTEKFNTYQEGDALFIVKYGTDDRVKEDKDAEGEFSVKFRDTVVTIQTNPADKASIADKFSFAQYVNTQKTSILVQIADKSGLAAPVYLINLNENKIDVVSLYRASTGAKDKEFTKGLIKVAKSGYLINNDFFITNVNAKAYMLKREKPEERIQGDYFNLSRDKQTLVFLLADALYQVHYATNEVVTVPLGVDSSMSRDQIEAYVASNFSWTFSNGIAFLKKKGDKGSDKVVDIASFK